MKPRFFLISLSATLLLISQASIEANAQKVRWRAYSPPDNSFSVELPAPLVRVKSFDGEHGVDFDPDQKSEMATSYAAIETSADECRFGITVVNGKAKQLGTEERKDLLEYLSVILIGDDDDGRPETERTVSSNGLKGKEYFFTRENETSPTGSTGSIHTRGRIFDTKDKIYVVIFVGQNVKDLTSSDAERFFSSFRIRP